jgi:anti-sigma B factor antagonist
MQSSRHISHLGDRVVVTVLGDIDLASAPALRHEVLALLGDGYRRIVLDLTPTDFMDSIGLGVVVAIWKRVRVQGGEFAVVCPEPRLKRIFQVVELDKVLPLHDSVEAVTSPGNPTTGSVAPRD